MKICINGTFVDEKKAKISALDNGFLYGDGIYDTMRTYNGKILELDLHLKRIKKSTEKIGIKCPWSLKEIEQWINTLCAVNRLETARVRVTITRGDNGFDFLSSKKPLLVITSEKLVIDPKVYSKGVNAETIQLERILPEIKTVGLTAMLVAYRQILPKKIYEAILVDDKGFVLEGASTNVFFVKNGRVYTPAKKMLPGLTRARVMALVKEMKLPMKIGNFKVNELMKAEEIFLTNRPREIIPVVCLNGKKVGNGRVGSYTKKIMEAYREYALKNTK